MNHTRWWAAAPAGESRRSLLGAAYLVICAALLTAYLAPPLAHLNDYAWDYDEGVQLQTAALANAGYRLYAEIVFNKPPLLTWLLQAAFRIGGTHVVSARLAVLGVTALGFLALGWLADLWWGRPAGAVAMGCLLALPELPVRAAVAMQDLPAASFGVLSLAFAARWQRTGRYHWLALSALAGAAMFGTHPLLVFWFVPVLITVWKPSCTGLSAAQRLRALVSFGIAAALVTLLWLLAVDRAGLVHWVVRYNLAPSLNRPPLGYLPLSSVLGHHLAQAGLLWGLAAVSIVLCARARWRGVEGLAVLTWLCLSVVLVLLPAGRRTHYGIFVSYPAAATAGAGVTLVSRRLATWRQRGMGNRRASAVAGGVMLGLLVALLAYRLLVGPEWATWSEPQRAAREALRSSERRLGFVVSDDPFLVFSAGRLVPPALADTSYRRADVGYLAADEVIAAILEHQARLVVTDSERLNYLPGLAEWLGRNADKRSYDTIVIFDLRIPTAPAHPLDTWVGESVRLTGYTLTSPNTPGAGGVLTVTLFWQSTQPVGEDVKVFVHLLDADGRLVAQQDGTPMEGMFPTSAWPVGVTVPDPHLLWLGDCTQARECRIAVGMYRYPSLERLRAEQADGTRWPGDVIVLGSLRWPVE